jgi:hypothetical protein
MKNFPHQYSELARFRRTLAIVKDLLDDGGDISDDVVLGYGLARAGVYNFQGEVPDLEARIREEMEKPARNQGARTAARDGRRSLDLFGFIDFVDRNGRLTEAGTALLAQAEGSNQELIIWREAVIAMRVADKDGRNVSHPMRILLRLLADHGPLSRGELALALEANDDGEAEYERIVGLIPIAKAITEGRLQVTSNNLANAVKILPALALQLRLAIDLGDERMEISEDGDRLYKAAYQFAELAPPATPARATTNGKGGGKRRAGIGVRKVRPGKVPDIDPATLATLSPEEQIEIARLRVERTKRHQEVVFQVSAAFAHEFEVLEDRLSFDALLVPSKPDAVHFLLEIKTLELDEINQTMRAVGQLPWYAWVIKDDYAGKDIIQGVVYDRTPSDEICAYLDALHLGAFSCVDLKISACNSAAHALCPEPVDVPANYAEEIPAKNS